MAGLLYAGDPMDHGVACLDSNQEVKYMRKAFFALALLPFLAGCATTTGGGGGFTKDQLDAIIAQVRAGAAAACSFQPEAASVSALINALYPAGAAFTVVVQGAIGAICTALPASSAVKRGAVVQTRIVRTERGPIVVRGVTYK